MSFDFFRRKNAESPLAWQMQKDGWEEGIIVNPPRPRGIEIGEAGAQPSRQAVFRTHGSSAAIIMIIPFTYDLLKHHSALMGMIHCSDVDADSTSQRMYLLKEQPLCVNTRQDGDGASMKHH
ncbi:hypothetical protein B0H34DRAFT_675423 [Crassisporium funariophilum]|nr:hypothetical protein B0H34DRAFT_675423 [Crassisporium funariophilum]